MKRATTVLAAAVAAGLLFAGCSGSDPVAASSTSTPAPVSTSVEQTPAGTTADGSGTGSAVTTGSVGSPAPSSSTAPTSESSSSSTKSVSTLGNQSGALDGPTTMWFTTFCGTLEPLGGVGPKSKEVTAKIAKDPKAGLAEAVTLFQTAGTNFTTAGTQLKELPPPTFAGGDKLATAISGAFLKIGPIYTEQARKLAAIDPTDKAAVAAVVPQATKALQDGLKEAGTAFEVFDLYPATQKAIENIPACKAMAG